MLYDIIRINLHHRVLFQCVRQIVYSYCNFSGKNKDEGVAFQAYRIVFDLNRRTTGVIHIYDGQLLLKGSFCGYSFKVFWQG